MIAFALTHLPPRSAADVSFIVTALALFLGSAVWFAIAAALKLLAQIARNTGAQNGSLS
jgi:hypothetical protein